MERSEALELLASQHEFPGPFEFRVVVGRGGTEAVVQAITGALSGEARVRDVVRRDSRNGTYASLRIRVEVPDPETVLRVYAAVKTVEGVHAVM